MRWVVDGSNVLGALNWNRESRQSKERLASLCSQFARREGKRLVLCFDGAALSGFATRLGQVSVRFCHPRSADDVIVELTRDAGDSWTVVTSDTGIANRVRRRAVSVISAREFSSRLQGLAETREDGEQGTSTSDEFENYFSNPKNRIF